MRRVPEQLAQLYHQMQVKMGNIWSNVFLHLLKSCNWCSPDEKTHECVRWFCVVSQFYHQNIPVFSFSLGTAIYVYNTFLSHTSCCRLWHLHQLKFLWRTCIWSWNSLGVAVWKMSLPWEGSCLKHRWDPWVLHHLADVWLLLLFVFSFVDITKSSAKNIVIHTCLDDCESLPRNGMTTTCLVFDIG